MEGQDDGLLLEWAASRYQYGLGAAFLAKKDADVQGSEYATVERIWTAAEATGYVCQFFALLR